MGTHKNWFFKPKGQSPIEYFHLLTFEEWGITQKNAPADNYFKIDSQ
jgi:hypothetical protein